MLNVSAFWKKRQALRQSEQPGTAGNPKLSQWSSPAVPNSGWCSCNFTLGVGMILFQRSTKKVVVVNEPSRLNNWFFPRGRKDQGETLEAAALREAYEESGYRAEFMPVYNPSRAPAPPTKAGVYEQPNTEPIYASMAAWRERKSRLLPGPNANIGYEYLTLWYIGQIADDAVPETGTGLVDEENFVSHLLTYEEALKGLWAPEQDVLRYAWAVFLNTLKIEDTLAKGTAASEQLIKGSESSDGVFRMEHGEYLGVREVDRASIE